MPDEEVMKEYIKLKKQEKREKANAAVGRVFKAFGGLVPKGIRHPDSLVRNAHLYMPSRRGRTILK